MNRSENLMHGKKQRMQEANYKEIADDFKLRSCALILFNEYKNRVARLSKKGFTY